MNTYAATTEATRAGRVALEACSLSAAGYSLTNTGGNIQAWRLTFGAGDLLITEDDGSGAWSVLLYGAEHSEPLESLCGVPLADAIEAGEVFRLQASGCNA